MGWLLKTGVLMGAIIFFIPFIHYAPAMGKLILGIAVFGGIVGGIMSSVQNKSDE